MIRVEHLSKEYKIARRKPGLRGAAQNLFHRTYDTKAAVSDVSFSIDQGEMVGYIGANGAGKSTTIKMLCGILTPTAGEVKVAGIVPYKQRQRNARNIGAVFGQRTQLFWDIPARESFNLLKHIYQIPQHRFAENLRTFSDVLELEPLFGRPVRQMSLGEKMRCELAAAFLQDPLVVYLDEPTIGLDVSVKARIRQFIREMNRNRKTTVILTTHDMQDIEEICSRLIMIDAGRLLYDGDLRSVRQRFGNRRTIHFDLATPATDTGMPAQLAPWVFAEWEGRERVHIQFDARQTSASDVIAAMLQSYAVRDLTITDPSIESIVKDIYERGLS